MILLAETRQADRDKTWTEADAQHRQQLAETTLQLLQQNTDLTQQIEKLLEQNTELTRQVDDVSRQVRDLTVQIHGQVVKP
jgi:cell division protein FtsB